jgi:hypothetical protein
MISSIDLIDSTNTIFRFNEEAFTSCVSKPTAENTRTSPVDAPMVKDPSALETADNLFNLTEIVAPEIGSFDPLFTEPEIPD